MHADQLTPKEGIVVFDNHCVLCNNAVRFLIRIDKKKRLLFTSFDSNTWKNISGFDALPVNSMVFYLNGVKHLRSDAVIKIIESLGYPWKILTIIKFIPFVVREKLYSIIARNRYSIFGRKSTCDVISTNIKSRYLT